MTEIDATEKVSTESAASDPLPLSSINSKTTWKQTGITVAGRNGQGNELNQLDTPQGICIDDDNQCIYVVDAHNHRVVELKFSSKKGRVVAGGNGPGDRMDQLNRPKGVIVDKTNDSLIISDNGNSRVVRWPRQNGTTGEAIISDIICWGLWLDSNGDLYVTDEGTSAVRRHRIGPTDETVVAGGNGRGVQPNQLDGPTCLFVDKDHSVYVTDFLNHRVMKWEKGAEQGIAVVSGGSPEKNPTQLFYPQGITIDQEGNVYVVDMANYRIMRWPKGATEGTVVVGGIKEGFESDQLNCPSDLTFDRDGNLYVVDLNNHRVQKFLINPNET